LWFQKQFYLCFACTGRAAHQPKGTKQAQKRKNQNLTKVAYEKNDKKNLSVYSKRVRAGKRRTYFFDVKATRGNDYYITITESRRRAEDDNFDRHKVFVYKEDFNKFIKGLTEAVDYVKTDLMPDFDFDSFNHDTPYEGDEEGTAYNGEAAGNGMEAKEETEAPAPQAPSPIVNSGDNGANEEVDKW
jgi:hypothetical protein